jgi:hypothetical protein
VPGICRSFFLVVGRSSGLVIPMWRDYYRYEARCEAIGINIGVVVYVYRTVHAKIGSAAVTVPVSSRSKLSLMLTKKCGTHARYLRHSFRPKLTFSFETAHAPRKSTWTMDVRNKAISHHNHTI